MNADTAGIWSWQLIFLSVAVVIILLEGVRGWRLGLARQVVRLLALAAAYGLAYSLGSTVAPIVRHVVRWPDPLLHFLGGALLGFLVYAIISALGSMFFKRTAQQQSPLVRLIYGCSGAFIGLFFGAFFIWLIFISVRLIGSVAQAQVRAQESLSAPGTQPVWRRRLQFSGQQVTAVPTPNPLMQTLARMKESVEGGMVGGNLKSTDPLPGSIYQRLERLSEVASEPEALERFLTYPGARQLTDHPKVMALRNDPAVFELVKQGRIFELLQNQRLLDATNDPTLRGQISRFDLDRALDYALESRRPNEN